MRRSPAIFSVYMPSDHATTPNNVTPGPRGRKFACKRGPFLEHILLKLLHVSKKKQIRPESQEVNEMHEPSSPSSPLDGKTLTLAP